MVCHNNLTSAWILYFLSCYFILMKNGLFATIEETNVQQLKNVNVVEDFSEDLLRNNGSHNVSEEIHRRSSEDDDVGWSSWGDWTSCSRSCDGGVSSQARHCNNRHGCRGENKHYRICSMQPCPEQNDFRAQQCFAYNNVPYHSKLYEWEPHYDAQDPCSLTCRAKGYNVVAQLYPKVLDGTRCREGSLDMCINGKCQPVGCDLQLGSTKKVDACGVCGGDGSSCGRPIFFWEETPLSTCSVSCGGGVQMSRPACKNKKTNEIVDEHFCDVTTRPAPTSRECNIVKCPAIWMTDDWNPCSASCSGGWQDRKVYCAETTPNSTLPNRANDSRCPTKRPKERRPCNTEECPRWYETHWSGCSVTCGQGFQIRNVICRDARGHLSDVCDHNAKPIDKQPCTTGLLCHSSGKTLDRVPSLAEVYSPIVQPYPSPQAQKFTGTHIVSSEPSFVPDHWSACSVTCGEGVKQRKVQCKIFLEFSRTIAALPDTECPGPKPVEVERCVARPCSLNRLGEVPDKSFDQKAQALIAPEYHAKLLSANAINENEPDKDDTNYEKHGATVTYSWRQAGFTPCSASCLGGIRESIVQCVRDHDQAAVSPFLCDIGKKLDVITQTCNDQPCPPRWNISDFSKCTKPCGGGVQARQAQCVHDVTRGNTLVIPNSLCTEPAPRTRQLCNVLDCRPQWITSPWSKCTHSCNGGTKSRKVDCKQLLAMGKYVGRPNRLCPLKVPQTVKKCNVKACVDVNQPDINYTNQTYLQASPTKQVSLKVGGRAAVFKGTRLKIKCPVRRYDRSRIRWAKDHNYLSSSKRIRISRKGTLKIKFIQFSDSGVYTCIAGSSKANISIAVKPRPVPFSMSDEDRTVERPGNFIDHLTPSISIKSKILSKPNLKLYTIEDQDEMNEEKILDIDHNEEFSHEHSINKWPSIGFPRLRPNTKSGYNGDKANSLEANIKTFDTWEYQHGDNDGPLYSDQNHGYLERKTQVTDNVKPDSAMHIPSGLFSMDNEQEDDDSHNVHNAEGVPHIRELLVNLKNIFNPASHVPRTTGPPNSLISDEGIPDNQMAVSSFVLGKGKAENLEFDWMITNWSECSVTCGGNGYQVRVTQCMVRLHNVTKTVDNSLCKDAGLNSPPGFQACGLTECPRWESGSWSVCENSRCFTWNTAIQRRDVRCKLTNGTQLDDGLCDNKSRPREKRECYNSECRGEWQVGEWSECNAPCGKAGFQSRILQCVWFGTQRPAGNACREQPRPTVHTPCTGPPCMDSN